MTRFPRRLAATLGCGALALVALVALAGPAGAHATAGAAPGTGATAAEAGRTSITLTVEHGCGSEPTTTFRAQLPEGATDVQPQNPAGWTSSVLSDQVVWTGGSLEGEGSFTLELVLAQPAGSTVVMPAIQGCPSGAEEAWIQLPGSDGAEPEYPAPTFVVPANSTTATTAATTTTEASGPTTSVRMALEQTPITQEGSETNSSGLVVFIVVVAMIVGGAVILYLRHRNTGNTTRS